MLSVERIEDAERFAALSTEWDALLRDSAADGLFLTWEWLHTWWRHLAGRRRLFLLAARSGGQLVAIAPLVLAPPQLQRLLPLHSLQFLGTGTVGSDYLDVIVRRGWEKSAVPALAAYLRREGVMLELRRLSSDALAWRLAERLEQGGWSGRRLRTDICPFIRLAGHTWESYLAAIGHAHRYNLHRRQQNVRRRYAVEFHRVTTEEERGPALDRLIALHEARWRERGRSEAFSSAALVSFHHELTARALARGWLRLFELRLDGRAAASLYGFRYADTFSFYQSGFDPQYAKYSVGLVTMGLTIKSALEEGAAEYDLLHGNEPYKFLWAREARELASLEVYPRLLRGLICRQTVTLGRAARRLLPAALANRLAAGVFPWM